MKRRDFVKGLAVSTAAASAALAQQKAPPQAQNPVPATSTIDQGATAVAPNTASSPAAAQQLQQSLVFHTPNIPVSQPDLVGDTDAHYFSPARSVALQHLCEVLMPASNGYPSAMQAGVPAFLDFLIGGSPADRQAMYNNGLDRLNADAMKQFHVSFDKTSAAQADAVIRPHLQTWINDHPPTEPHKRFVALVHRDIRTATINSPVWAQAAETAGERTPGVGLYWWPVDPATPQWVHHGAEQTAPITKRAHA